MPKLDIMALIVGFLAFAGTYALALIYVGPFVGGLVGFLGGIVSASTAYSLVMIVGGHIRNRHV